MSLSTANRTGAKKPVTINLLMGWLLFDIMNETFLRGRTLQDRTNHKEVASMFASEDAENQQKILRSIKKSFGEIKAELSDYLSEVAHTSSNKNIDANTNLEINLEMPSNFNDAVAQSVDDACHAYIVNSAVAEWYVVTNANEAKTYFDLAANALELLRFTSSKRARPQVPED